MKSIHSGAPFEVVWRSNKNNSQIFTQGMSYH